MVAVIAVGSIRSCGVTTIAAALGAVWPEGRDMVVIEADPVGGTVAAESGWASEPSLVTLAAAARRRLEPALIFDHTQSLPGGGRVLAAPASSDLARDALSMLTPLLDQLHEFEADVVIDCGRLESSGVTRTLWDGADSALVAVRPRLGDLQALATWCEVAPSDLKRIKLVVVGDGPYGDTEIAETLGLDVVAHVPWDPKAARALFEQPTTTRELRLSPLVRCARSLAERLVGECAPEAMPTALAFEPPKARSPRERLLGRFRELNDDVGAHNGSVPGEVMG
jgi:MinD-like ATPase involved in chromosome partitioning or flagellar assembly